MTCFGCIRGKKHFVGYRGLLLQTCITCEPVIGENMALLTEPWIQWVCTMCLSASSVLRHVSVWKIASVGTLFPVLVKTCLLTLWPEICWFSQVRLWPSRRKKKIYLLEINRPTAFSHNPSPSTPPTPISCQSAAQLMDQSTKHDTEHDLQITDGSPTCTHCTETLDGCETTKIDKTSEKDEQMPRGWIYGSRPGLNT